MRPRGRRVWGALVYWLTVFIVSLAVAAGIVAYLISRDEAVLETPQRSTPTSTQAP